MCFMGKGGDNLGERGLGAGWMERWIIWGKCLRFNFGWNLHWWQRRGNHWGWLMFLCGLRIWPVSVALGCPLWSQSALWPAPRAQDCSSFSSGRTSWTWVTCRARPIPWVRACGGFRGSLWRGDCGRIGDMIFPFGGGIVFHLGRKGCTLVEFGVAVGNSEEILAGFSVEAEHCFPFKNKFINLPKQGFEYSLIKCMRFYVRNSSLKDFYQGNVYLEWNSFESSFVDNYLLFKRNMSNMD